MKTVHIIARNHMDPSWLRCFRDHYTHPARGDTVRPYADVEEQQISEYMDFAELYGVKYQIEQSLTVKEFLRRRPDERERFASLVKRGLLELAGGGEAVIDYNLTQGESWVRNHLYSRKYYDREFGVRPRFAITPDIFGLPSQLPQFFRSLGYDALIIFDRVMKNNKPFWPGLDGTPIVLDSCFLQPPEPNLRTADCVKLPSCSVCRGEGCAACAGTGLDMTYDMTRPDKELYRGAYYGNMSADAFLETLLQTEKDEYFVMITTEEPRIGGFLYGPLSDAAERHGMRVEYHTFEENHTLWCPGQEERLRSGDYTEDELDRRPEGNPASCGCYTSRIEIKKQNRALENLLAEAESMSVLALLSGGFAPQNLPRRNYPAQALETLWNQMAFVQFHDCVTGTLCDAAYTELLRILREIRRGVMQICSDAAAELFGEKTVNAPEGWNAAVLLNPTPFEQKLPVLRASGALGTNGIRVTDLSGAPIPVAEREEYHTDGLAGTPVTARLRAKIPPFGYRVVLWQPIKDCRTQWKALAPGERVVIENEFLRVSVGVCEIEEVYDKTAGRKLFGVCSLAVGRDIGSVYGRSEPERDHRVLEAGRAWVYRTDGCCGVFFSGDFHGEPQTDVSVWTQEVRLYEDEALVRFETRIDSHLRDARVYAHFEPAFAHGDTLFCEVPFGTMERGDPGQTNVLGLTDEWPSLGFAGVSNGTYSAAVLKGGLPASRLKDGAIEISLMRAVSSDDPKYAGALDMGVHIAEYAVCGWRGAFADGNASAKAASYLYEGFTFPLTGPGIWNAPGREPLTRDCGCLLPWLCGLPAGLRMSAVKRAENGKGIVIRLWESAGRETKLALPGKTLQPLDTLENPLPEPPVGEYTFRPFEIATFLVDPEIG